MTAAQSRGRRGRKAREQAAKEKEEFQTQSNEHWVSDALPKLLSWCIWFFLTFYPGSTYFHVSECWVNQVFSSNLYVFTRGRERLGARE